MFPILLPHLVFFFQRVSPSYADLIFLLSELLAASCTCRAAMAPQCRGHPGHPSCERGWRLSELRQRPRRGLQRSCRPHLRSASWPGSARAGCLLCCLPPGRGQEISLCGESGGPPPTGLCGVGAPETGLLSSLPVIRAGKPRGLLALHVRCGWPPDQRKPSLF